MSADGTASLRLAQGFYPNGLIFKQFVFYYFQLRQRIAQSLKKVARTRYFTPLEPKRRGKDDLELFPAFVFRRFSQRIDFGVDPEPSFFVAIFGLTAFGSEPIPAACAIAGGAW